MKREDAAKSWPCPFPAPVADARRPTFAWTEIRQIGGEFGQASALLHEIEKGIEGIKGEEHPRKAIR